MAHVQVATRALGITTTLGECLFLAAYLLSESPWLNLSAARDEHVFFALARHHFRRKNPEDAALSRFYDDACAAAQAVMTLV